MNKRLHNTRFQRADDLPNKIAGCFIQFSDDLYLGPVYVPDFQAKTDPSSGNPSPQSVGIGPLGRIYVWDVVPAAKSTTAVAAAQAVLAAGNLTINGTKAAGGVATLDIARGVDIVSSSAGDSTQIATVYGTDSYGQVMSEAIAFNGVTRVAGKKAFKTITRVAIDVLLAGNGSVGSTDVLGLPLRVTDAGYLSRVGWAGVLAEDAGTFVAAVTTSPATTTTGDVRGTYVPSSAPDAAKRLVISILLPALAVGPNATRVGALGVTQA